MTILDKIKEFNTGRDAQLLERKYYRMTEGTFRFYRATSHLFYDDLKTYFNTTDTTKVWGCGDLHLQNFGSYKASNRLVYFDINDFDDAQLMPATWELARMVVSILLAAEELAFNQREARNLATVFLKAYTNTLAEGKPVAIERRTVTGILQKFLEDLENRKRKQFLKTRTREHSKQLQLLADNEKVIAMDSSQKRVIEKWLEAWVASHPNPFFERILDIGVRVTGGASLGLERYVVLVESHKHKFYLLDLKEARPSTLVDINPVVQPAWPSEAQRIVEVQRRVTNVLPTLLNTIIPAAYSHKSFVIKELQPEQDKFDFHDWVGEIDSIESVLTVMAQIVASGQLRSAGRQGSSIADELIAFAQQDTWQKDILNYSEQYLPKIHRDYFIFCEAYEDGFM